MPESYAASVNPPRRAKKAPIVESPTSSPNSESATMRPYAPRASATNTGEPADPPPPPAKRGRKPGPLSKSAREAQRRLNHSIIEKARRTKINDALASLRQLVPVDYGQKKAREANEEDGVEDSEEEDDGDEEPRSPVIVATGKAKEKGKEKGTGKKEEKEKEFKLEILVRTVSFLQDLLKRVAVLEAAAASTSSVGPAAPAQPCQNCLNAGAGRDPQSQSPSQSRKRKHMHVQEDVGHRDDTQSHWDRAAKIPRRADEDMPSPDIYGHGSRRSVLPSPSPLLEPSRGAPGQHQQQQQQLPPISSWLIDPQLLPEDVSTSSSAHRIRALSTSSSTRPSPHLTPYLPSPPSSTHVEAVRTSQMPPHLSLGPVASAAIVGQSSTTSGTKGRVTASTSTTATAAASTTASTSSTATAVSLRGSRTPEDENAASLLLQISASSPPVRPDRRNSRGSLLDPSAFLLHGPSVNAINDRAHHPSSSSSRSERDTVGSEVRQVQTPSSMLGLHSVLNKTKY